MTNTKPKYHLILKNAYVSKTRNIFGYEINKQGPKMIWVTKVKN